MADRLDEVAREISQVKEKLPDSIDHPAYVSISNRLTELMKEKNFLLQGEVGMIHHHAWRSHAPT